MKKNPHLSDSRNQNWIVDSSPITFSAGELDVTQMDDNWQEKEKRFLFFISNFHYAQSVPNNLEALIVVDAAHLWTFALRSKIRVRKEIGFQRMYIILQYLFKVDILIGVSFKRQFLQKGIIGSS